LRHLFTEADLPGDRSVEVRDELRPTGPLRCCPAGQGPVEVLDHVLTDGRDLGTEQASPAGALDEATVTKVLGGVFDFERREMVTLKVAARVVQQTLRDREVSAGPFLS
jgi:hypothetical protein